MSAFEKHYNTERLHSAIEYVTPHDKLYGREKAIWDLRDHRLEEARELRRQRRAARTASPSTNIIDQPTANT